MVQLSDHEYMTALLGSATKASRAPTIAEFHGYTGDVQEREETFRSIIRNLLSCLNLVPAGHPAILRWNELKMTHLRLLREAQLYPFN
jgi:hypothetical protein